MGRNKRILRSGTHCVPNLRNSCYLYSFCQEFAKMQVRDSVIIIFGEQRSHGDNVLRIVVLDSTEITKLTLSGCIVGYDVGIKRYTTTTFPVLWVSRWLALVRDASGLFDAKSYSLMPYFLMPSPIISSGINILRVSTRVFSIRSRMKSSLI